MEFSSQEYWNGFPFLIPGDLPDPGIEPGSPALQADSLLSKPPGKPLMLCGVAKLKKKKKKGPLSAERFPGRRPRVGV